MAIYHLNREKVLSCLTLAIVAVVLLSTRVQAATCAQSAYSALSVNGVQYTFKLVLTPAPQVVSGLLPLNVQFRDLYEGKHTFNGVSLRYTVDDTPVGPVLTNSFAWTLDTTTIPDGTHVLSMILVNQPTLVAPCFAPARGREQTIVVNNNHVVLTGPQTLPIPSSQPNVIGPFFPQVADFVQYPGNQPHPTSHPYPYKFIAPAGGMPQTDYFSEPLTYQLTGEGEGAPAYYQLSNGSLVTEELYVEHSDFDETSYPYVIRQAGYDGPQDDNLISPYVTYVPNLDGPGFYGISIDGRLFLLNMDGSVQTLVGWVTPRSVIPYYYLDTTIPISKVRSQQTHIGTFDVDFLDPLDLAIDPNNHQHIYVADNLNHRIALVDLSQNPPVVSTYAGTAGKAGYLNGPRAQALFNGPSSLVIANDETIYVADGNNNVIRRIDPLGNVTTLVGIGYPGSATPEPSMSTVAAAPLTYAPRSAVPFNQAYINYPLPIRFDSKGNLVMQEPVTRTVRYIDLNAQTVTTLAQLSPKGDPYGSWNWIDVDRFGNVGAKDDVFIAESVGNAGSDSVFRIPITGTTQIPPPDTVKETIGSPLHNGHACCGADMETEYPWGIAIDDQEGRWIVAGFGSTGVASFHVLQQSDPPFQQDVIKLTAGKQIWNTGTVPNFPFGSRPSFAAVHGYEGHSNLGNVKNWDDMIQMNDTQLAAYLQAGADGAVPRPEVTGNDMRNLIYFIRRSATGGDLVTPAPSSTDTTPPVIGAPSATQLDSTDISVSFTTSKPSLCFVSWGTTSGQYFNWSAFESGYNTSHSITVSNLPAGLTIYFKVRAKDNPGNQSVTTEQSITLH